MSSHCLVGCSSTASELHIARHSEALIALTSSCTDAQDPAYIREVILTYARYKLRPKSRGNKDLMPASRKLNMLESTLISMNNLSHGNHFVSVREQLGLPRSSFSVRGYYSSPEAAAPVVREMATMSTSELEAQLDLPPYLARDPHFELTSAGALPPPAYTGAGPTASAKFLAPSSSARQQQTRTMWHSLNLQIKRTSERGRGRPNEVG